MNAVLLSGVELILCCLTIARGVSLHDSATFRGIELPALIKRPASITSHRNVARQHKVAERRPATDPGRTLRWGAPTCIYGTPPVPTR